MSKRRWRWVTRDLGVNYVRIWHLAKKPCFFDNELWLSVDGNRHAYVCFGEFERLTGIKIEPGECCKIEFAAKVIDP